MIYRVLPYMYVMSYVFEGSQDKLIQYVHTWSTGFVEADISMIYDKFCLKRRKWGEKKRNVTFLKTAFTYRLFNVML